MTLFRKQKRRGGVEASVVQGISFSASFASCGDLLVGWHGIDWFSSGCFVGSIDRSIELMALACFLLQEVVAGCRR